MKETFPVEIFLASLSLFLTRWILYNTRDFSLDFLNFGFLSINGNYIEKYKKEKKINN